jgi:hypothetical protein
MKIKPGVQAEGDNASSSAANGNGVSEPIEITIQGDRLSEALQYGATAGLPSLVKVSYDQLLTLWRPLSANTCTALLCSSVA